LKTTISDVARAADVSVKTVSRVLNDEKYVTARLRARVEEAITRLDYRPSSVARALRSQRSFQIALIYDNPNPYYVHSVQEGVRARCNVEGFRMLAQPCDVHAPTLVDDLGSLIDQTQLDGVILAPPVADCVPALEELRRRRVRHVRISPGIDVNVTASVFIDHVVASTELTDYLIGLGHRRIGFIQGHPHYIVSNQRLQGYRAALQQAGIAFDPALVRPGEFTVRSGQEAGEALLSIDNPPTAIFASNDEMAAGVLAAAYRRGVSVPSELSIVGFDDTELSRSVWPPLTTIRQPMFDLGYAAADLLFTADDRPERRQLEHHLMIRESTAAPKG
jgi:LacI family transcriptional regulator